jgi:hypothetical protein
MSVVIKKRLYLALSLILSLTIFTPQASQAVAGQFTTRKVTMADPTVGQNANTYTFNMTVATPSVLKGLEFLTCTTAFGGCTPPTGLTYAGAATGSNPTTVTGTGMGTTANWVKDATSTANNARYTYTANATSTTASAISFAFSGVTNGTNANSPYYIRVTSFTDTAFTTNTSDTGNVVAVPTQAITITGTVQEQLTFCVYNTGGSCAAGVTSSVSLGTLSSGATISGTSKFDLSTNANGGVNVTYAATSFTGTSGTIGNAGARATSGLTTGVEQFLIQVSQASGAGLTPNANYTAANYSFQGNNTPDTIATAVPTAGSTGSVTYNANISTTTKAGVYNSTFLYQAVGTF